MRKNLIAFGIAGALLGTVVTAQTHKAGIEAVQRGDHAAAAAIWKNLAEKGDADAAFNLGQAYRFGRGVPSDSGQAAIWFERAARQGHLDAQVSFGILLLDSGNLTGGMRWLMAAAKRGEPRALQLAGIALFNGDGVQRDPVLAYAYVSRAAAQGLPAAKATLAEMDQLMPLEDRRKGLAVALDMAKAPDAKASPPKAPAKPSPKASPPPPVAATAKATATASARGVWRVQLGAFSARSSAEGLFARLKADPVLAGRQPYIVQAGKFVRLQAGPFESRAAAASACAKLKPRPCFPVEAR